MKSICKICNIEAKRIYGHALKHHNITKKDYYDRYVKTGTDGKCEECGKETMWDNQFLYWRFCSKKCARQWNLKHTNVTANQRKSREVTCLKKYGVKHPFQSKDFQRMCKDRMIEKYGSINPSSIPEFVLKRVKNFSKSKPYRLPSGLITYRQGYEPQFLKYVFENKLLREEEIVFNPTPIKFQIIGETFERNYYPDFYIPKLNLVVEIKSDFVRDKLDTYFHEKQATTTRNGFNYICIINNNFDEFVKYLKEN